MATPLRILVVCTHNRTRSVICAALLGWYLNEAGLAAEVDSAGIAAEGFPPTDGAVEVLSRWGIDASAHRSSLVTRDKVFAADLVLTAQPDQVVWIAGRWPDVYSRTFTLPELVQYTDRAGGRGHVPLEEWIAELSKHRPPARTYLERDGVPAIEDPTGQSSEIWERVVAEIEADCADLVEAMAG